MSAQGTRPSEAFTGSHYAAAGLLALAAACGPAAPPPPPSAFPEVATVGVVHGARVVAVPGAEFPIQTEGLLAEVGRAIEIGAEVWGVDPEILAGWTLAFQGGWFPCLTPGGAQFTWGCTYPRAHEIWAAPGDTAPGCRAGVIVHELGHVVIGDGQHEDPRWPEAAIRAPEACGG